MLTSNSLAECIEAIKDITENNNVKALISSRPTPECVAAFGTSPQVKLQDLTKADITSYVLDVIGNQPCAKDLATRYPKEFAEIIYDVAQKADGVFLWVVLACRALKFGLEDSDRIKELQRLVDGLPPELEDMFRQMLAKTRSHHKEQGAKLLRICYEASAISRQELSASSGRLSSTVLAVPLSKMNENLTEITEEAWSFPVRGDLACAEIEGRLRSRTGGLLEITSTPTGTPGSQYHTCRVIFMHRSVFDFLNNDNIWHLEDLEISDKQFDAAAALSLLCLFNAVAEVRGEYAEEESAHVGGHGTTTSMLQSLDSGLAWGAKADAAGYLQRNNIFWHFRRFLDSIPTPDPTSNPWDDDPSSALSSYRCSHTLHPAMILAAEFGAVIFMKQNSLALAELKGPRPSCNCKPLLHCAVDRDFDRLVDRKTPAHQNCGDTIRFLLAVGCDANEPRNLLSPWDGWMKLVCKYNTAIHSDDNDFTDIDPGCVDYWVLDVTRAFIGAGVDLTSSARMLLAAVFGRSLSVKLLLEAGRL